VAKFKYLEITGTYQNCIHEEVKSRLREGNACYTIMLPVVSCVCVKLGLSHEGLFDDRVLRRMFQTRREGGRAGGWRRLHNELHNIL
jgi:hypothetical protein